MKDTRVWRFICASPRQSDPSNPIVDPTATLCVDDKSNKKRLERPRIELLPLRHAWLPDRDRLHLAFPLLFPNITTGDYKSIDQHVSIKQVLLDISSKRLGWFTISQWLEPRFVGLERFRWKKSQSRKKGHHPKGNTDVRHWIQPRPRSGRLR